MIRPIDIDPDDLPGLCRFVDEAWRRWPQAPLPDQTVDLPDPEELLKQPEACLRRFRQLASTHLLWRDLTGQATIEATGQHISALARSCIRLALQSATARMEADFGELLDDQGRPIQLAVLGLGKLGGDERNFNSDIDLVFVYQGKGRSTGRRALDAPTYLKRVALELIRLLDSVTQDGRVWVVDTRLRPFGSAGALIWSLGAIEQYFLNEGRAWERYAWMKAAPVAGDLAAGETLLDAIQPFIFRRYLDYGIFEDLRGLHDQIDARSRQDSRRENIKSGPGGIRELEFLVQSQQILRGGRDSALQVRGFLPALQALSDARVFDPEDQEELATAYGFLRILENRLQAMSGRQTHHLPNQASERQTLARLMGFDDWAALHTTLQHQRNRVQREFSARFGDHCVVDGRTTALWPPGEDLEDQLLKAGLEDPKTVAVALRSLAERLSHRAVSAEGRARLERLMPSLLAEITDQDDPRAGLDDLLQLIEQVSQRSAYLALLHERPATLKRLVQIFRRSGQLARWIVDSPQLLDDLLDPIHGHDLPSPPPLDLDDTEVSLHALGRWRQAGFLRTALAEMDGALDAVQAANQLSSVASICCARILELAQRDPEGLAVIAYGNLGAGLLHFDSDLDLVFLHGEGSPPLRTAQRFLSYMQLPLLGGRLFEIDTRLRPNGNAGTLVSRMSHFANYQSRQALTWEHQALIRARWIAGDPSLEDEFETLRRTVLSTAREAKELRGALADMRLRQKRERRESPIKALLTDLQFIAECGLLEQADGHDELIDLRQPDRLLRQLGDQGWLPASLADSLVEVWRDLLAQRHRQWLSREPQQFQPGQSEKHIRQAWNLIFDPST